MKGFALILALFVLSANRCWTAEPVNHPDVLTVPADLEPPALTNGEPAPGKAVLQSLPRYAGTEVAHALYLPTDWSPDKRFPVMVEYLGNTACVRDYRGIGYGLTGGKGFIWVVLPFVSADGKKDEAWWWGDVNATVAYAKEVVPAICQRWGGDPKQVILTGYSRGGIACNYIGLHDDEIAKLWRAMIPVSHYDDAHIPWGMTPDEQNRAKERLLRLRGIPQLIAGEYTMRGYPPPNKLLEQIRDKNLTNFATAKVELGLLPITEVEGTRKFITNYFPQGNYTILDLPWVNHGSQVLLRDTPERRRMREWLQNVLHRAPNEAKSHDDVRMKWWREARFGMFVHWGLFSAAGGAWQGKPSPALGCWMQNDFKIPVDEYRAALMPKFTGERFDPDFIAQLAKDAGMKYVVPITKHHEGFCLFDSKFTDFKISNTPARRDWIKELTKACRQHNLKVGFYYSQNLDWHHPGGGGGDWDAAHQGDPDKYVDGLVIPQLRELLSNYGAISILWWDIPGGVINQARAGRILQTVRELRPDIVMNNRLGGGFSGDTETPEQFIPATGFPGRDWETCQTINGTWGYTHYDRNWKSTTTLIRELIDTASKGGNYLLNIGPKPDGTVPQSTIDTLHAIGGWMKVHGDSIYGTTASPFSKQLPWGRCTQKEIGSGVTRLYLHIFQWPFNSVLRIPALENEIVRASQLSQPGAGLLKFSRDEKGDTLIRLPIAEPNDYATVVVLDIKGNARLRIETDIQSGLIPQPNNTSKNLK